MLFIHPMWDSETERIGKKKCTPSGYALHVTSDVLGFVGLILLFGAIVYLGYRGISGGSHTSHLWLLAIPFGLGLISEALYVISWRLAIRNGFKYGDDGVARWKENGREMTYKFKPE